MQTIFHLLDMVLHCMTESLPSPQYIALHRRPVGDWYKFASGPARHLHTSWYKCSSLSKLSTYRPLDTGEYCTVVRQHLLLRSPVRRILVVGWYMFLTGYVFHLHKTECKG